MAVWNIVLPDINGAFEVGIAAVGETAIPAGRRLKISQLLPIAQSAVGAASYAYHDVWNECSGWSAACRPLLAAAAAGMVLCDAVAVDPDDDVPDGSWEYCMSNQIPTILTQDEANQHCTPDNVRIALTCAAATKANWWLMNHHTGVGSLQGYAYKTFDAILRPLHIDERSGLEFMYLIGHWMSTKFICGVATTKHVQAVNPAIANPTFELKLSNDAKLRFNGHPAGTAKVAVAANIFEHMVNSPLLPLCPNVTDFIPLMDMYRAITKDPAWYHKGAWYLTGENKKMPKPDGELHLGRAVTWIGRIRKNSTFYRSPHCSRPGNPRESKAVDYDDFSGNWDRLCHEYQSDQDIHAQAAVKIKAAMKEIGYGGTA